jgi:hypothetical protein
MSERFLSRLAGELATCGVHGSDAQRVLAEARDHLLEAAAAGEADAGECFGDPAEIARLVASELATARARRATFASFAALALTGVVYGLVFVLQGAAGGPPDIFGGRIGAVGPIAGIAMVVLPQLAFVSGCLALLRALRLGRTPAAGRAELGLLRARSRVALVAASGTLLALVAYSLDFAGDLGGWWVATTVGACVLLLVPLAGADLLVTRSARPLPAFEGEAGDVFDDLAPIIRRTPIGRLDLADHPWPFALLCAAVVGGLAFAAGWYAEGDPGSGLVRGGFEAAAFVISFAALGRKLGLRRSN